MCLTANTSSRTPSWIVSKDRIYQWENGWWHWLGRLSYYLTRKWTPIDISNQCCAILNKFSYLRTGILSERKACKHIFRIFHTDSDWDLCWSGCYKFSCNVQRKMQSEFWQFLRHKRHDKYTPHRIPVRQYCIKNCGNDTQSCTAWTGPNC